MNRTRNRRILVQRPMRSDGVVVIGIGFQNPTQMCLAQNNNVVQALAPDRSDQPFGKAILPRRGWCNWLVPNAHGAQSTCDNGAINAIPVSDHVAGAPSQGNASVIWRATHSAVGFLVTLIQTRSLRSSWTTTNAESRSKPIVGTTNKSIAAMSGAWLRRKVSHPRPGGPRRLTMYLATLGCATSNPSLRTSPWRRGAPHRGFSMLICRINARSPASICGRPPKDRDFQRQ